MAEIGTAIAGIGSAIGSAVSSAVTWVSGLFSSSAAPAGAASTSSGFLGLGSGFWTALGAGASILGTLHTISSNNQMAQAVVFDTAMQGEASALDFQRQRDDARREKEREAARRTTLLAAQGGLTDGADMVLEALIEGERADARMVTDMGFEQGAINRRIANTWRGTRRQNIGALIQGGARIGDLLSRA